MNISEEFKKIEMDDEQVIKEYFKNSMLKACLNVIPKDAKCEEEFDVFYFNCFNKFKQTIDLIHGLNIN